MAGKSAFGSMVPVALALLGLGLAVWLLIEVDWTAVWPALLAQSPATLALALAATLASYAGLAAYDVIAMGAFPRFGIRKRTAAMVGAVSFGLSNFLGFPWLVGAAVRQRLYDLRAAQIGEIVSITASGWVAFWMVVAGVCGGALLFAAPDIAGVSPSVQPVLGVGLVLSAALAFLALGPGRRFTVADRTLTLLSRRLTFRQMLCATVDLVASALVLWVLLPEGLGIGLAAFLPLFVLAVGLGVLSHVPAGIGSFEAVLFLGLDGGARPEVTAAILLYRLVRTVLPFMLAGAAFGAIELARRRRTTA